MTIVLVHGGASGTPKDPLPDLAYAARVDAAHAVEAVEEAVVLLEDDPRLNAGYGACLARDGTIELDAGIADGHSGTFGAAIGVTVRHPVTLARRVLENTPHVALAGAGAMELASDMEILEATTEDQIRRWELARDRGELEGTYARPEHVDTVGAVALDERGHLAAASSTGGVFGKMRGRVGDSPIFGAGTYASRAAAVVGTGVGELFMTTLACARVGDLIAGGVHPQDAVERILIEMGAVATTPAGLVALDADGRWGVALRGASMPVAGPDGIVAVSTVV